MDRLSIDRGTALFQRAALASVLMLLGPPALAQPAETERNATAAEIEGEWQLLPLPDGLEPKLLPANPWPAECQYYSYGRAGDLKSLDKSKGPCEPTSAAQLREAMAHVPAVVSWKYDLSPSYQKGIILVSRSDVKDYGEIWEPHLVAKTFSKEGVEFREGDLILYLADMKAHKIVWIRHLRRVS